MESYKKISIKAMDVKPGDILTGRIETNRWPNIMTVKEVHLTNQNVRITTTTGLNYHFIPEHEFQKEITPAEEGEMAVQQDERQNIQDSIDRMDANIYNTACDILDELETHIKNLTEVHDKRSAKKCDPGTFETIGDDFKKASESAYNLAEHAMDQEALKEELKQINQAADEGPHGRNK